MPVARNRPPTPEHRTFAYVRCSTDMQAETGQSLQVQEAQLRGWAQMTGRTIDAVVVEAGTSGGVPFAKRPEGSKLLAELKRGDTVVVAKLDRFSRNLFDCLQTSQEFQRRGVHLFLLDVATGDAVTGNGAGKLYLSMLGAFAEFERDRISERIKATKQRQRQNGEFSGGTAPFGWVYGGNAGDKHRALVPVPKQQVVLRRVRRMAAKGLSPHKIAADLHSRGTPLSHVTIRKVLAGRSV
jgi:DNA invertase Pin-like site-specific DNA recombinase